MSDLKFCVVLEKYLLQSVPKASRDDGSSPAQIGPHDGALSITFGKVCLCCSAVTALPLQFLLFALSSAVKRGCSNLHRLCLMRVRTSSPAQEAGLEALYLLVGYLSFSQITNNW